MTVSARRSPRRRYWVPDPERELRLRSDRDYAARFRELFEEAVRCRLRDAEPVGSTLSGGIDSSSIACVARRELAGTSRGPVRTYSLVFERWPECDERPFIRAVHALGGFESEFVRGDAISPLADLEGLLRRQDAPTWVTNLALHTALYRAAAAAGTHVLLDGFAGDDVVGHGVPHLATLARRGRWLHVAVAVRRLSQHHGIPASRLLWKYAVRPALPRSLHRATRALGARPRATHDPIAPALSRALARRVGLADRLSELAAPLAGFPDTFRGGQCAAMLLDVRPSALEAADHEAAAVGVQPRYPFLDLRLVEFCLALPAGQRFHRGWTRVVARRAMEGVLPEAVRWRTGKGDMTSMFTRGLLAFERERLDALFDAGLDVAEPFVDVDVARQLYAAYRDGTERNAYALWRPALLALWLRSVGTASRALTPTGGGALDMSGPECQEAGGASSLAG